MTVNGVRFTLALVTSVIVHGMLVGVHASISRIYERYMDTRILKGELIIPVQMRTRMKLVDLPENGQSSLRIHLRTVDTIMEMQFMYPPTEVVEGILKQMKSLKGYDPTLNKSWKHVRMSGLFKSVTMGEDIMHVINRLG